MPASNLGPEDYRFVECSNADCKLRFPGVPGVACPLCKELTRWVADRCLPPQAQGAAPIRSLELLLDNVRSVFNVGSIFRSAEGAGIRRVYLCGITPIPQHKAMAKTGLGAELLVPWHHSANALAQGKSLIKAGKTLWALEYCQDSRDLFAAQADRPDDLVLVLGNEVTGVDPELLALCRRAVHIPMRGAKQSLNVSSAMAIAAYALT